MEHKIIQKGEWAGPQSQSPAWRAGDRPGRAEPGRTISLACRARQQRDRTEAARGAVSKLQPVRRTRKDKKRAERFKQSEAEASRPAKINHVIKTGKGREQRLGVRSLEEVSKVRAEAG